MVSDHSGCSVCCGNDAIFGCCHPKQNVVSCPPLPKLSSMNHVCNVLQVGPVGQITGPAGVLHVPLDACKPSFPIREGHAWEDGMLPVLTLTHSHHRLGWASSTQGWDLLSGAAVEAYPASIKDRTDVLSGRK